MDRMEIEGVRIERLEPMTVASCKGFGPNPEGIAWSGLMEWMEKRGIPIEGSRFFGFNNPNPTPGSPNYGYEQWLALDAAPTEAERGVASRSGIAIKDFAGGLYAVARHSGSPEGLPRSWGALQLWVERSSRRPASHQWLERFLNPGLLCEPEPKWAAAELDIYYPVSE